VPENEYCIIETDLDRYDKGVIVIVSGKFHCANVDRYNQELRATSIDYLEEDDLDGQWAKVETLQYMGKTIKCIQLLILPVRLEDKTFSDFVLSDQFMVPARSNISALKSEHAIQIQ
jgi:hypothetical protein